MSTDLVYAAASLEERKGYAAALSRAGDLVPKGFRDRDGSANPGKILLAAEYGNMLGLHPMAALTGINVIDGKPSPAPALMSALVRAAGHKIRVRTTGKVSDGTIAATVTLIRSDDPQNPFESTWDIDRAKRADLWGKSGSWSKYPEAMLKWRALSEVCRDGAEDVLLGAHYVPEELGRDVNEAGELLDVTATARDVTPSPADPVVDAEVIDESTGEVHPQPPTRFDPEVWENRIGDALGSLDDLRKVFEDARDAHVLDQALSNGEPIRKTVTALAERLQAQQAQDAAEDGDAA